MASFAEFKREVEATAAAGDIGSARAALVERVYGNPAIFEYPYLASELAKLLANQPEIRVAILSTYTMESIAPLLSAYAAAAGQRISLYFGPFGQFETEILNTGSGLHQHQPRIVFVSWRIEDISPAIAARYLELSPQDATVEADSVLARLRGLLTGLRSATPDAAIVVHRLVAADDSALGILDREHAAGRAALIDRLNSGLGQIACDLVGVHLLDAAALAARVGPAWYDPRYWFRARAPHGPAAWAALAAEYAKFIRAAAGQAKKVLACDLDNTLWGGVLGEDGVDGIQIGGEYPGSAFAAFQCELRQLARRGVVLAINSKNNEADVREAFENRRELALALTDFAASRINWNDKAANLRELADELSLGLDSFVFIDDSAIEVAHVRRELPEVTVVQTPADPADLPGLLSRRGYFDSLTYSAEDRQRSSFYQAEAGRRELSRAAAGDLPSFWRSLQMRLIVSRVGPAETPRVAQLTQRTNQFNMTTRRYSEAQVAALAASAEHFLRVYRLEDRFGDNGQIAVVLAKRGAEAWTIDTFLMSCRVIGRTVESSILSLVAAEARAAGAKRLLADFVPTKKNAPARGVYAAYGFQQDRVDADGTERYSLDLAAPIRPVPDWMTVRQGAAAGV